MKRKLQLLLYTFFFLTVITSCKTTKTTRSTRPDAEFKQFYPIGEDADMMYKTSYIKSETILFEANPFVRYSFYNNIHQNLLGKGGEHLPKNALAFYAAFKPQFRMYTDNSLPVKMPSYKVQLGFQYLFILHGNDFLTLGLESGHYSNGQSGCAFSELYPDGSRECDSIYKLITPNTNLSDMLNRKSGNFSTNLTELLINYRFNKIGSEHEQVERSHAITLGFNLYHDRFWGLFNFGGYSDEDIKIYGRMRYTLAYTYSRMFGKKHQMWMALSENMELIQGAHPWVNPFRTVTSIKLYPVAKFKEFGICMNYTYGHDNYNFRFVDAGSQFGIGLTWSIFPPFKITKREKTTRE